jgi:hypothetical protein
MKKFIDLYGLTILLVFSLLNLMNGCGTNVKISHLQKQVDSLTTRTITGEQMQTLIKTTPALETIHAQETSHKNNTPVIQIVDKRK